MSIDDFFVARANHLADSTPAVQETYQSAAGDLSEKLRAFQAQLELDLTAGTITKIQHEAITQLFSNMLTSLTQHIEATTAQLPSDDETMAAFTSQRELLEAGIAKL